MRKITREKHLSGFLNKLDLKLIETVFMLRGEPKKLSDLTIPPIFDCKSTSNNPEGELPKVVGIFEKKYLPYKSPICGECIYYCNNFYLHCAVNPISAKEGKTCNNFTEKMINNNALDRDESIRQRPRGQLFFRIPDTFFYLVYISVLVIALNITAFLLYASYPERREETILMFVFSPLICSWLSVCPNFLNKRK